MELRVTDEQIAALEGHLEWAQRMGGMMREERDIADLLADNETLKERVRVLEEALAWYRDNRNYYLRSGTENSNVSPMMQDGGKRARAALAGIEAKREAMFCPECGFQHIDSGEWATRLHHAHLCLECGHKWRREEYVFGVALAGGEA